MGDFERSKVHIFSDFDGTITGQDTLIFLAENLGGGPEMVTALGRLIADGTLCLRDGIAAEMRSIRAPFDEAAELLEEHVSIDPAFPTFAAWCAEQNLPLTVLSAGFHELIELFLPKGEYPQVEILANHIRPNEKIGWQCEFRDDTEFGHDKSKVILAAQRAGKHCIFVGDGLSDRAPAEVADEVFAKHTLAEYCRKQAIAAVEFTGFADLQTSLAARLR